MKYRKMQQSKFGLPVTATGSTQNIIIIIVITVGITIGITV